MSAAARLIERLHGRGVETVLEGEALRLRPSSAIPPDLLAELRTHKAEVVALLRSIQQYESDPQERAAMMEEPALPPPGTPERDRLEAEHQRMCAGLLRCADVKLWMESK
jgi:hypothetical protein